MGCFRPLKAARWPGHAPKFPACQLRRLQLNPPTRLQYLLDHHNDIEDERSRIDDP
jgi:hypothetical protein